MPSAMREEARETRGLPDWLGRPEGYQPLPDRDGFVTQSLLAVTGLLAHLRLDAGHAGAFSPSAPAKLVVGLACILLNSLSTNFVFTLIMLALVLVRACLLPIGALRRLASVSLGAAGLGLVLMLPAIPWDRPGHPCFWAPRRWSRRGWP